MVTDELVGLPVELRKAAKTTTEIIELERTAFNIRSMDRYRKFHKKLWLPAGLVVKETVGKERVRECIRECESDMMPLDTKRGLRGKVVSVQCWNDFKEALLNEEAFGK